MAARTRGRRTRASVRLMTALLCPVALLLLGACGGSPSAEETPGSLATPRAGQSSAPSGAPGAPGAPAAPGGRSKGPEAAGSPLRIPLPTDELLGRLLPDAEAQLKGLIADACGGDQCISLRIEPQGSMDPTGRTGCATRVVRVPDIVTDFETGQRVLYVARGGVITLVVELRCDPSAETEPGGAPSPEPGGAPSPESTATTSP